MTDYFSKLITVYEYDFAAAKTLQRFSKAAFDFIKNTITVGVIQYISDRHPSVIMSIFSYVSYFLLLGNFIGFVNSFFIGFFHPFHHKKIAFIADFAITISLVAVLGVGSQILIAQTVKEIAAAQSK